MGCQGFWGYLLKPRNILILAIIAMLVFGIYKQAKLHSSLPTVIQILSFFENVPIYSGLLDDKDSMKQSKEPITKSLGLSLDQQEASFQSLVLAVLRAPNGTLEKEIAIEELHQEVAHRAHIDCVIEQIAKAISSPNDFWWLIDTYAPNLVDDWNCYRTLLSTYETYCGGFSMYGVKYGHVFANMCNNGIQQSRLAEVASEVCGDQGKC
ncbi:Vacuolar-processing enzyme [Bienertia sinuspersici]